jgi:bifunctional DNA-binding transcriptional regulator/antitoxin component of YhaV-PrlF toxin-antitoxin module
MAETTLTIDKFGRMVIPRSLRTALGVSGQATLKAEIQNGRLVVGLPDKKSSVVKKSNGLLVIKAESEVPAVTALKQMRKERYE